MNTNRRAFVQKTLLGSVGFLAGNALLQAAEEPKKLNEIGLILGVLQKEMKTDFERHIAAGCENGIYSFRVQ